MAENKSNHFTDVDNSFANVNRFIKSQPLEKIEMFMISEAKYAESLKEVLEIEIEKFKGYKTKCIKNNFLVNIKYIDYYIDNCYKIAIKYNIDFGNNKTKKTFEHKLNDNQLNKLLILINKIKLFKDDVDILTLNNILDCTLVSELSTNTTNFAHLFNRLSIKKLISNEWQSVANCSKLFKGSRGAYITNKNLSSTLQKINTTDETIKEITKVVSQF